MVNLNLPECVSLPIHWPRETSCSLPTCGSSCNVSACQQGGVLFHEAGAVEFQTHVCGSAHKALSDIVYSVTMQTEAVRLVRSVYQVLDVLSYVFVQLLEHRLSLLGNSQHSSMTAIDASTGH